MFEPFWKAQNYIFVNENKSSALNQLHLNCDNFSGAPSIFNDNLKNELFH